MPRDDVEAGGRSPGGPAAPLLPAPGPAPGPPPGPQPGHAVRAAQAPAQQHAGWRARLDRLAPPYFIIVMIFIMAATQAAAGAAGAAGAARLALGPRWRLEPWRLLTYSLVHASAGHLALNAAVALFVSWRLEREQGRARAAAVWAAGLAAGGLGAAAWQPRDSVVGASAAVYALLLAHLPNVALRWGGVPAARARPAGVAALLAAEGGAALWAGGRGGRGGRGARGGRGVAWSAHALGGVAGLVAGFLCFRGEHGARPALALARAAAALLAAAGGVLAVLLYLRPGPAP